MSGQAVSNCIICPPGKVRAYCALFPSWYVLDPHAITMGRRFDRILVFWLPPINEQNEFLSVLSTRMRQGMRVEVMV